MKTSRKITLIVIPIVIIIVIFLISFLSQPTILTQPENNLNEISTKTSFDVLSSFSSPVVGSSDASVTIMAFNDYQCLSCKHWYENEYPEILENLIETRKAKILFLDSSPLGDDSILISQATFCADDQGKYSEYQETLFASQQKIDDWAKFEQLKQFAIDLGLNQELFEECLDSGKYEQDVLSNIEYSTKLGVEKIPLFKIVNFEGVEHLVKGGLSSEIFEVTVNRLQN